MDISIHSFTSNFKGGGARTNLFYIQLTNPVDSSQDALIINRAKAAQLPAWTTNELSTKFMGRSTYYSGVRTYQPWTVTILEDSDYKVRNTLESWQNWINLANENIRGFSLETDDQYKSVGNAYLLDKLGQTVREYTFYGLWPQSVGSSNLSWDEDNIMHYDVTFRFDYFEVSGGTSGNANSPSQIVR